MEYKINDTGKAYIKHMNKDAVKGALLYFPLIMLYVLIMCIFLFKSFTYSVAIMTLPVLYGFYSLIYRPVFVRTKVFNGTITDIRIDGDNYSYETSASLCYPSRRASGKIADLKKTSTSAHYQIYSEKIVIKNNGGLLDEDYIIKDFFDNYEQLSV